MIPIVVNTELGSGLAPTRGVKPVEPSDVAAAIVEALQTRRYEVYVPRSMAVVVHLSALLPRKALDAVARLVGSDRVLARPDHAARAGYETRIREMSGSPKPRTEQEAA